MKLSLSTLGIACVIALATYACADSESDATPNEVPDGSSLPNVDDAGTVDAAIDSSADAADADAGPKKVCSDSKLCHLALPVKENLVSVWADGAGIVWSVSKEGSVLKLENGAWKVHASSLGALVAIWGSGPTDIWAAGEKGVYHSTGAEFTASTLPGAVPTSVTSLWGSAANDVWVTGNTVPGDAGTPANVVLRFNGTAWSKVTVPAGNEYYRVWGHPASGVWLAGRHTLPPPDEFTIVTDVYRRAVGKTTFAKVTLPTVDPRFPENPILANMVEVKTASTPAATTMWLHSVSVASYNGVLKGTSADNGLTFTWVFDDSGLNTGTQLNAVVPVDAMDGWAVGTWGQVRRWNGTEWKPQAVTLTNLPVINELNAIWATTDRAYIVGDEIAIEWRKP